MKLSARVAVCVLVVVSGALEGCSKRDGEATPLIIGGHRVESRDADSAVVAVHIGGMLCTGALIAPRYVLTAQHCVEHEGNSFVTFGLRTNEGPRTPVRIHRPPTGNDRTSDIAVLELAEPASITPIPVNLSASALHQVSEIRVVGFGVTGSSNADSGIKRAGSVRTTNTPSYLESVGTDGTCFGDSGGPALAMVDGREQIVGVTSHGTASRCEDGRGRYVRTDVHGAFLQPFLGGTAPTPPGSEEVAGNGSTGSTGASGRPGASGSPGAPGTTSTGVGSPGTASAGSAGTASAGGAGTAGASAGSTSVSTSSVVVSSGSSTVVSRSSSSVVTVTVTSSESHN